ncbi:(2Fe-2S)-binding protein [Bacillus sp. FJAT-29814]|uniref:(2Fe-2S)-binding protein n=1 Tax=Bacillus sp. FJAT-29814 TaxID=1729688 RepID=UPI0009E74250|nr:(2Fe-2S)-binding protein [Bacillus sp. FJAT-29814]
MNKHRILEHPVLGKLTNQKEMTFTFDGKKYIGYEGDTIASALLAHGIRKLRVHEETGTPRGIYCNIGHCFECRVTVNGKPGIRACLTEINSNMVIESGKQQSTPFKPTDNAFDLPRTYSEFENIYKEEKEG